LLSSSHSMISISCPLTKFHSPMIQLLGFIPAMARFNPRLASRMAMLPSSADRHDYILP
jgi:hypothetical protein